MSNKGPEGFQHVAFPDKCRCGFAVLLHKLVEVVQGLVLARLAEGFVNVFVFLPVEFCLAPWVIGDESQGVQTVKTQVSFVGSGTPFVLRIDLIFSLSHPFRSARMPICFDLSLA